MENHRCDRKGRTYENMHVPVVVHEATRRHGEAPLRVCCELPNEMTARSQIEEMPCHALLVGHTVLCVLCVGFAL